MKGKTSLKPVTCPECGSSQIHLTCTHVRNDIRVRYKRCKDCDHKFVTEQVVTQEAVVAKKQRGPNAKLNEEDVLFIRQQLANGIYTITDLALQYEVEFGTISRIKAGKTWKHLLVAS